MMLNQTTDCCELSVRLCAALRGSLDRVVVWNAPMSESGNFPTLRSSTSNPESQVKTSATQHTLTPHSYNS